MFRKWREHLSADAGLRRLLPLLLPGGLSAVDARQGKIVAQPGWEVKACDRGLGATFYVFLRLSPVWASIPPAIQEVLESTYRYNLAVCTVREHVLQEILQCLKVVGAPPVLLKGLAFACELYPEPAARLTGDIDLLIEPDTRQAVHQELSRAGFRLLTGAERLPADHAPEHELAESVYLTQVGGQDILLEIHHQLISLRPGGGKEKVFRSRGAVLPPTRTIRIPAGEVRVLDYEAAFLHALRHIALHHRLIGFRWHHDLALMLVNWRKHLQPAEIRAQCRAVNSEKILDVELALLADLFGREVLPEEGWRQWRTGGLPWEYPLYRHVARGGRRTPLRELVRTLLAPGLREQIQTLT